MSNDAVRFSLLGPVRAWRGDDEIDLGAPQQRAVLALLMAYAGQPVTMAQFIDALWHEEPPLSAVNAVHRSIGLLRRALEPTLSPRDPGQWLSRSSAGYQLAATAGSLDLLRLRALADQARTAPAPEAVTLFSQALRLRLGPCGSGLEPGLLGHPVFVALEHEILAVAREAADTAVAHGEARQLLAPIRRLAAEHPLDEALAARLVRLLAATGLQADAITTYARVRERLADELGVSPGVELRAAYEHVVRSETVGSEPEPPTAGSRPRQLPADLPTFVGRDAEMAAALALAPADGPAPTVVITAIGGMAGVGKTTLAIRWAHSEAARYPDGQLYVNLRGFGQAEEVMSATEAITGFLEALGVRRQAMPSSLDALAALYRSTIADRRMLILLDNARDEEHVRGLLPGTPGCLVIVTSRNPLRGLVARDGAHPLRLDVLTPAQSRDFLTTRLGAPAVDREPHAVDAIVDRCRGLPLALAIVAARALSHRPLSLAAVADDLRAAAGLADLTGFDPASNARTVFSWSYQILSADAARLFRLMSQIPGTDITVAAAASLCGLTRDEVAPLVSELTLSGLVGEGSYGRYTQHDLVRAYAGELIDAAEAAEARRRVLDHYYQSLDAAEALLVQPPLTTSSPPRTGVTPEQFASSAAATAWIAAEQQTLYAAIRRATSAGDHAYAVGLNLLLVRHFLSSAPLAVAASLLQLGIDSMGSGADPLDEKRLRDGLATALAKLGRFDDAIKELERSRLLEAEHGDLTAQAATMMTMARILYLQGAWARSLLLLDECVLMYVEAGNQRGQARALSAKGWVHTENGDHEAALAACERALAAYQDLLDPAGEAATWHSIGHTRFQLGKYAEAEEAYNHAIELCHRSDDRDLVAQVLESLGDIYAATGGSARARTAYEQALSIKEDLGLPTAGAVRAKLAALRP
ncbi:BTAD domain-containing putative transcriptional regulator [Micromonospora sp. NPDC047548]|uniref:AfsR/SARP family transcriptional regulator n=1 Tax=Micromonospora sp. NPDC047548 TaxID=3155624 RepID=UPI0033D36977